MNRCEECGEWTTDCQCEDHGANTEPQPAKPSGQDEALDYEKFYNDVKIHFEMLCTDEIRAHAYADVSHDLAFQIFRVLGGYRKSLEENASQRSQGRREAAEAAVAWFNKQTQDSGVEDNPAIARLRHTQRIKLRKAILGAASDEKGV